MHKILVIGLYFPFDAFISCTSRLVYARRMVPAYTKCDVQLIKLLLMVTNIVRNM